MWTNQNSRFLTSPETQPRALQTLNAGFYTIVAAKTATNTTSVASALGAFIAVSCIALIGMSVFLILRVHYWKKPRILTKIEVQAAADKK